MELLVFSRLTLDMDERLLREDLIEPLSLRSAPSKLPVMDDEARGLAESLSLLELLILFLSEDRTDLPPLLP